MFLKLSQGQGRSMQFPQYKKKKKKNFIYTKRYICIDMLNDVIEMTHNTFDLNK